MAAQSVRGMLDVETLRQMVASEQIEARDLPQVPGSLNEAIHELEGSSWARETFGEDLIEHYLHFFRTEQRMFDKVVTNWERARYYERA